MTDQTTPVVGEFVHVETRVELPLEPPTAEEFAALGGTIPVPYSRTPWLVNRDLSVEIDITVKNLDPDPRTFSLLADGISEFHEFVPGYMVEIENGEVEVIPNPSQWERNLLLEGNEIRTLTIRQEELDEVAVDLATIANGAPNPNQVNFRENQSSRDPRAQPFIPKSSQVWWGSGLGSSVKPPPTCWWRRRCASETAMVGSLTREIRRPGGSSPPPRS